MSIVAIPGLNVRKIDKDRYSVAVTNGNIGAGIINRKQLEQLADYYGVPIKEDSKVKKAAKVAGVLASVAALATAVIKRKDIAKAFNTFKAGKAGKAAEVVTEKAGEVAGKAKEATTGFWNRAKEGVTTLYNRVAKWVGNAWTSVRNFFTGLFTKKQDVVEKGSKKGIGETLKNTWKTVTKGVKNAYTRVKEFFGAKKKTHTIFDGGFSAETNKLVREGIAENVYNLTNKPSLRKAWRSDLASKYGATNVH